MRNSNAIITIIIAIITLTSCSETKSVDQKYFYEQIIDLAIKNKNQAIELPELYDSLVTSINTDSLEDAILVNALKERGFRVINWGRGNNPPKGPRVVDFTMQKGSCTCEVRKTYYSTINDSSFEVAEQIKCH